VVGTTVDRADPVTYALPAASTATACAAAPFKYVEYTSALPVGFTLVTNPAPTLVSVRIGAGRWPLPLASNRQLCIMS
jgi:hypothetical protein